eukprot:SAG22_NODE_13365_length_409_cov_0.858065_1_plen_41_part_10
MQQLRKLHAHATPLNIMMPHASRVLQMNPRAHGGADAVTAA